MEQMTRVTCLNLPSRLLKAPPLWWRRKPRRLDLPYRRQRDLEVLLLWLVSLRVRLRCILIRCILVFRSTTLMQLQQFEVKLPERVWRDIRVRTLYMKLSYRHDNTAKPIESAQSPSARYGIWKFRLPLYWVWSKNTRAGKEGMVDSKSTDSNAYTTSSESSQENYSCPCISARWEGFVWPTNLAWSLFRLSAIVFLSAFLACLFPLFYFWLLHVSHSTPPFNHIEWGGIGLVFLIVGGLQRVEGYSTALCGWDWDCFGKVVFYLLCLGWGWGSLRWMMRAFADARTDGFVHMIGKRG